MFFFHVRKRNFTTRFLCKWQKMSHRGFLLKKKREKNMKFNKIRFLNLFIEFNYTQWLRVGFNYHPAIYTIVHIPPVYCVPIWYRKMLKNLKTFKNLERIEFNNARNQLVFSWSFTSDIRRQCSKLKLSSTVDSCLGESKVSETTPYCPVEANF